MTQFKVFANEWLPPPVLRWLRLIRGAGISFKGDYATWKEAASLCTGYDAETILTKVLESTLKVKEGGAAFERDSVLFQEMEYDWPVLAGLMFAAARSEGRLNVLDFGGALGSTYFKNRKLLGMLRDVRWNVIEQTHYADAGRKYISHGGLQFYRSIEDCVTENRPNVILISSVLQYLESPEDILDKLSTIDASFLIIDRTPFSNDSVDRILIQRVPPSIYSGSYPMRVFSRSRFMDKITHDWELISSIAHKGDSFFVSGKSEFSFEGMLFKACE